MTQPQHASIRLDTVERAIADIAAGKAVVVVDDETARTRATSSSRPARRPRS